MLKNCAHALMLPFLQVISIWIKSPNTIEYYLSKIKNKINVVNLFQGSKKFIPNIEIYWTSFYMLQLPVITCGDRFHGLEGYHHNNKDRE